MKVKKQLTKFQIAKLGIVAERSQNREVEKTKIKIHCLLAGKLCMNCKEFLLDGFDVVYIFCSTAFLE